VTRQASRDEDDGRQEEKKKRIEDQAGLERVNRVRAGVRKTRKKRAAKTK